MKIFSGAVIAFFIILIGTQCYVSVLNKTVDTLQSDLSSSLASAEKSNWEECDRHLKNFTQHWDSAKNWMAIFIDHGEIDSICKAYTEFSVYAKFRNRAETLSKGKVLDFLLKHLPENERLTVKNLL